MASEQPKGLTSVFDGRRRLTAGARAIEMEDHALLKRGDRGNRNKWRYPTPSSGTKKPGTVSRPGTISEFQFPE
jgi:hypothetical protein